MAGKSINYYGYDKKTYYECVDMIHISNRNHLMIMNLWFLGVVSLYFILSFFNLFSLSRNNIGVCTFYVLGSVTYALVIGLCPKFSEKHSYKFLIINVIFMYSYGIYVSVMRPYIPAAFYLILLILTSLSYVDYVFRMVIVTCLLSSAFLWASYKFKTFSIAHIDTFNLILVQAIAIGMHFMFQRLKLQHFIVLMKNIKIQKELEVKSSFDSLTGLLNRGRFFSIAEEIINLHDGSKISIALFDLDEFKEINDSMGHQMGDKVIQIAGRTIIETLDISEPYNKSVSEWNLQNVRGLAGRLGGDEFIVLYRDKEATHNPNDVLAEILRKLNGTKLDGYGKGIKSSIGYTELKESENDLDVAYKHADDALYEAKKSGKNQIRIYGTKEQAKKRG